jgi:NADPH2:quinone reductase
VLRSRAITLMGSGIGSVALPRLLRGVEGVLQAAADGSLRIMTQAVPLAELADHWDDEASEGRKVFVCS